MPAAGRAFASLAGIPSKKGSQGEAFFFRRCYFGLDCGTAVAADVEARSQIDGVTVYPSGAEVTRSAKLKLEKGDHVLIFRDLPAGAVEGSIRVEGHATGKLEIGSVDTRRTFVPRDDAAASQSERRRLETEIEQQKDARRSFTPRSRLPIRRSS